MPSTFCFKLKLIMGKVGSKWESPSSSHPCGKYLSHIHGQIKRTEVVGTRCV